MLLAESSESQTLAPMCPASHPGARVVYLLFLSVRSNLLMKRRLLGQILGGFQEFAN